MKKILLSLTISTFFLYGCSHVSHEQFRSELERTQNDLRQEMLSSQGDGDVASLECSLSFTLFRQATMLCQGANAYCNVTQAWERFCLRFDGEGRLLPPERGVTEAMDQAIADFNATTHGTQQGTGSTETEDAPSDNSVE